MANSIDPALIDIPTETLDIEIKEWLDLDDGNKKGIIARAVIALANHGGGHLVIGFSEASDGTFSPADNRPPSLAAWSQDAIQGIIARYVDPIMQCEVRHIVRTVDGLTYPVISVPGGHRFPVRSKAASPDNKLVQNRIYIRRAGPCSEEPRTSEEWDRLLERCLQNRKDELLNAMRSIMAGVLPTAASATTEDSRTIRFVKFLDKCAARWKDVVADVPLTAGPAFPHGHIDIGFMFDAEFRQPSLIELRDAIRRSFRNHSGWPPFVALDREDIGPRPFEGCIEAWIGASAKYPPAHHSDYWVISPEGLMFTRMGYREDAEDRPGKQFDINWPFLRVAEAILEAYYLAEELEVKSGNLSIRGEFTGLEGRELAALFSQRYISGAYRSATDTHAFELDVSLNAIPDALPEIVHAITHPVYEHFSFFDLSKQMVVQEVNRLKSNQF